MVLVFMFDASWRLTVITFISIPCVILLCQVYGEYLRCAPGAARASGGGAALRRGGAAPAGLGLVLREPGRADVSIALLLVPASLGAGRALSKGLAAERALPGFGSGAFSSKDLGAERAHPPFNGSRARPRDCGHAPEHYATAEPAACLATPRAAAPARRSARAPTLILDPNSVPAPQEAVGGGADRAGQCAERGGGGAVVHGHRQGACGRGVHARRLPGLPARVQRAAGARAALRG